MTELITGANKALSLTEFEIKHSVPSQADLTVFCLDQSGKVTGDAGIVFFNQPNAPDGSVRLQDRLIQLNLAALPDNIQKLAVTITVDEGTVSRLGDFILQSSEFTCHVDTNDRCEAALILLEVYRHKGQWKVRFVNQGFNGGLHPLAVHYGVDVAAPSPTAPTSNRPPAPASPTPASPPQNTRAENKQPPAQNQAQNPPQNPAPQSETPKPQFESVTAGDMIYPGSEKTLSCAPMDNLYVHLDWHKKSGGLFGGINSLNLGAFIALRNGEKAILHLLGDTTDLAPYAFLSAQKMASDLQSGDLAFFPGSHLAEIEKILLFAYDYDKCPSWQKYQATLHLRMGQKPSQSLTITPKGADQAVCALLTLTPNGTDWLITPELRLFDSHKSCDQALGWGFPW